MEAEHNDRTSEFEIRLHDKDEEMRSLAEQYEAKLRSIEAEL